MQRICIKNKTATEAATAATTPKNCCVAVFLYLRCKSAKRWKEGQLWERGHANGSVVVIQLFAFCLMKIYEYMQILCQFFIFFPHFHIFLSLSHSLSHSLCACYYCIWVAIIINNPLNPCSALLLICSFLIEILSSCSKCLDNDIWPKQLFETFKGNRVKIEK